MLCVLVLLQVNQVNQTHIKLQNFIQIMISGQHLTEVLINR